MELGRVNLGTHAWFGWIICISWTRFLGGLTQHTFHTALCLYSSPTWQGGVELVSDAKWTKFQIFSFRRCNQYNLWWVFIRWRHSSTRGRQNHIRYRIKNHFISAPRKTKFDIISHIIVDKKVKITYQKITLKKGNGEWYRITYHDLLIFLFHITKIISYHDIMISNHRSFNFNFVFFKIQFT